VSPALARELERLEGLVDWERRERALPQAPMRVDVQPVRDLLARLGAPEKDFPAVHVAGSKGKGSVCALVAAGAARAGLRVGRYGSPHVERIHERVELCGEQVADAPLAKALQRVLDAREAGLREETPAARSTWFDVLTAAAFTLFAESQVELALVECGLGGRLDSTNVLRSVLCVITNIELEHTEMLGDTRAAIAGEKAGILRPGVPVLTPLPEEDEAGAVIRARASALEAPWIRARTECAGGGFEQANRELAGQALDLLGQDGLRGVDGRPLSAALLDAETCARARLPGRCERVRVGDTMVVLDGAHTAGSMEALWCEIDRLGLEGAPEVLFCLGRDKLPEPMLKLLAERVERLWCTTPGPGPYHDPNELALGARELGLVAETAASPGLALQRALAKAQPVGWVLATGSLHLVGAVRPLLRRTRETRC